MSSRSHKKAVSAVSMKPTQFKPSKWLLKQKQYLNRVNKMTPIIEDDEDMLKIKEEATKKKEPRRKQEQQNENDTTKESRQKRRDYHKKLAELKAAGLLRKW
jgi:hypothetical protein